MYRLAKKVLLIGWDAADWKIINPLLDAGKMPHLERFVNQGVMGNVATLYPELSPMLWTSIATGKRPFKHGIYGFTEPDPIGGGIRPVSVLSRKTKALWNILCQNGLKCNVVGWWPSHPAEPINGVMVSNHYGRVVDKIDKPWPMLPGTVHPPRLVENLADLRVHPQRFTTPDVFPFVPRMAESRSGERPPAGDPGQDPRRVLQRPGGGHGPDADGAVRFHGRLLRLHRPLLARLHALPSAAPPGDTGKRLRDLPGRGRGRIPLSRHDARRTLALWRAPRPP